jgi:hypothetical protein
MSSRRPPDAGIADSEHAFTEQAPLAENCCACAILTASYLPLLAVLDGLLKPMEKVCNRSPHLSEEPGGSRGRQRSGSIISSATRFHMR